MFNLTQLTQPLDAKLQGNDVTFNSVSIDTRTIKPGDLYVAISGENFDGHNFIEEAKAKGAVAALVNHPVATTLPQLIVTDTRLALGKIAALWRAQWHGTLIALTGSCGKTTVKEMMHSILACKGNTLATKGTLNNDYGVPLTLLQLNKEHEFAVIEMGANHPGEIGYLTQLAKPKVAFINNIAPAHLEGFGSIEGVAKAKVEIFNGLDKEGIALVNGDDHYADWISARLQGKAVRYYAIDNENALLKAQDIKCDALGRYRFILQAADDKIEIKLPVFGQHNVLNALGAATATYSIGANLQQIKNGLENMPPVAGRLVIRDGLAGATIFDDTYNANPASMRAGLQVLAGCKGKRIFIMGDMRELGPTSQQLHHDVGALAKQLGVDYLYACGEQSKAAVTAFGDKAQYFATQAELGNAVRNILEKDVVVLVKGSRGMKMENVVAMLLA